VRTDETGTADDKYLHGGPKEIVRTASASATAATCLSGGTSPWSPIARGRIDKVSCSPNGEKLTFKKRKAGLTQSQRSLVSAPLETAPISRDPFEE